MTRPILALHGSASSGAIWQPLIKQFGTDRIVLAPDLPGYGKNAGTSETDAAVRFGWLSEAMAEIGGKFDLVGHSFGGTVALILANKHPQQVNSIVLYEPIVPPSDQIKDAPEMQDLWALWTRMLRLDSEAAMAEFCEFWSGRASWHRLSEQAKSRLMNNFESVMLDFRQVFTGQMDIPKRAYNGPMTLLCGDQSHPIAWAMSERLSRHYPQAQIEKMQGLGHLGPVTHPEQTAVRIKAELNDVLLIGSLEADMISNSETANAYPGQSLERLEETI